MTGAAPGPRTLVVFDAYGTIFEVASAVRRLAAQPEGAALAPVAAKVAADWRAKQIQYSWWRAITGVHADFAAVTADALDWALAAAGLADIGMRERLLDRYRRLDAYPEVPAVLARLNADGRRTAILSNGSPEMLEAAVASAGIGDALDALISVETAGVFKPARAVYDLVGAAFGTAPAEVLFVSSNGWDAAAAALYGFDTVWVNRASEPVDRLPAAPRRILPDLVRIPELAQSP